MERLDAADGDRLRFDDDRDPLAPSLEETDLDRASRQLKIFDTVIGGRLRLEIDLHEKSQSLAREIASRSSESGIESFETVFIMPDAFVSEFQEAIGGENLLSGIRREHLKRTLNAWNRAIGITNAAINEPRDR